MAHLVSRFSICAHPLFGSALDGGQLLDLLVLPLGHASSLQVLERLQVI